MMKRVCVLLEWSLNRDSRAQRTARSMSRVAQVDVYFVGQDAEEIVDPNLFNENVELFQIHRKISVMDNVLRHSFFFLESRHMVREVLETGREYDVIYAHDLASSYAAHRLAKKLGAKIIYDVHDLSIETINQQFPRNRSVAKLALFRTIVTFMKTVGRIWERHFLKKVDLVLTTNPSYEQYLRSHYAIGRIGVVTNYPEYKEVVRTRKLYQVLNVDEHKNLVLYHGMLNDGRSLELITASAEHFNDDNLLVIVGNGPLEGKLKSMVRSRGLERKVRFLDHVKYEELFSYASSATIGVLLVEPINLSKKYATANKVTEYMASGIPVLASDSPEHRRLVGEAQCGFVRSFHSEKELGEFINEVTSDRERLAKMGQTAQRAFKERFNWTHEEPVFLNATQELLA
jgi:glycosyltransferase involved in cell wall biosynthesis